MTSNYHPIYMVFEKCMATWLVSFVNEFSITISHQIGFLKEVFNLNAITTSSNVFMMQAIKSNFVSVFLFTNRMPLIPSIILWFSEN